jgi:hypothetical protein
MANGGMCAGAEVSHKEAQKAKMKCGTLVHTHERIERYPAFM